MLATVHGHGDNYNQESSLAHCHWLQRAACWSLRINIQRSWRAMAPSPDTIPRLYSRCGTRLWSPDMDQFQHSPPSFMHHVNHGRQRSLRHGQVCCIRSASTASQRLMGRDGWQSCDPSIAYMWGAARHPRNAHAAQSSAMRKTRFDESGLAGASCWMGSRWMLRSLAVTLSKPTSPSLVALP